MATRQVPLSIFFGDFKVAETIDYIHGYRDIPAQNALIFRMTDGSWFAMRPSGTEPKLKFYYYAKTDRRDLSKAKVADLSAAVGKLIDSVQ